MALPDKRPYKAYAPDGTEHGYKTLIDQHQAVAICGYTFAPPGQPEPENADPHKRYEAMSAEELRKLCIARKVKGYPTLDRDQKIEALREQDKRDAEKPAKKEK